MLCVVIGVMLMTVSVEVRAEEPPPAAEPKSERITLGGFYQRCVKAMDIDLPEEFGPDTAWMVLRGAGLQITADEQTDMDQPLRNRHVREIGLAIGLKISDREPDRLFTRSQVEAFMKRYGEQFEIGFMRPQEDEPPR